MKFNTATLIALIAGTCMTGVANSQQKPATQVTYEQGTVVRIPASANREVANDTLSLYIYSERDSSSREQAYEQAVKESEKALAKINKTAIKVKNTNFQVFPLYDKNRIKGYRSRYSATLESKSFDVLLALAGNVSNDFMVERMEFSISEDLKQKTEKELMAETIMDIKDKADTLQKALGSSKLSVAEIDFTRSFSPMPYARNKTMMMSARGGAEMASDMAAPLPAEAGSSRVEIGANALLVTIPR